MYYTVITVITLHTSIHTVLDVVGWLRKRNPAVEKLATATLSPLCTSLAPFWRPGST